MKTSRLWHIFLVGILIMASVWACDLPSVGQRVISNEEGTQTMQALASEVAKTLQVASPQGLEQMEVTPDISSPEPVESSPTITLSPTVSQTPTPEIPLISVSVDTNCRYGPGAVYEYLGALLAGETSEVMGWDGYGNFWYIRNPDDPDGFCWVWDQYATVSGDTSNLPIITPPPTPTYTPEPLNFTLSIEPGLICGLNYVFNVRITNTGPLPLESIRITVEDLDTSDLKTQTHNGFGLVHDCVLLGLPAIDPGDSGFSNAGLYSYDPIGNTVRVVVKMCTEDGLAGVCREKTIEDIVPGVSDVSVKGEFEPVDVREVLAQLLDIPITTWNYKFEDAAVRHMGPMAQDFFEAYELGGDDRSISAIDSGGVAFAAIQGLYEVVQEKDARIHALDSRLSDLEHRLASATASKSLLPTGVLVVMAFVLGVFIGISGFIVYERRRDHG